MMSFFETIVTHVLRVNLVWAVCFGALFVLVHALRIRRARTRYEILWLSYVSLMPAVVVSAFTGRWFSWMPARAVPEPAASSVPFPSPAHSTIDTGAMLAAALGAIVVTSVAMLAYGAIRLKVAQRSFAHCDDARVLGIVDTLRAALGISRRVRCMKTDSRVSPFSLGARHPMIVLPDTIADHADDRTLRIVAAHELTHIRHHDFARNLLQKTVRALFAFNPVAWIADAHLDELREVACDQDVLRATESDRRGYAQTLLHLNVALRDSEYAGAVTLLRRHSNLKRRIAQMKHLSSTDSKIKVLFLTALLALTFVILSCSGEDTTTAVAPEKGESQDIATTDAARNVPADRSITFEDVTFSYDAESGRVVFSGDEGQVIEVIGEDGKKALLELHEDHNLTPQQVKELIEQKHGDGAYFVEKDGNTHLVRRTEHSQAAKKLMQQFHEQYGHENLTKEQLRELHVKLEALEPEENVFFEFKDGEGEGDVIWVEEPHEDE